MSGFVWQRRWRGPVQAVIFDWAGTTVDHGCMAPALAFTRTFEAAGVPVTIAEARAPMGAEKRDHIAALMAMPRIADAWAATHGHEPREQDIDNLYAAFLPHQLAVIADHAAPVPGCLETVRALRQRGIRIGANTGYAQAMMDVLAPAAAAHGYVPDDSVNASDVPRGRPAPSMALRNAANLGVDAVAACIKVDDTPVGIEEGLAAGMWTVGVALSGNEAALSHDALQALAPEARAALRRRTHERLARTGAHLVIDSVADFLPALAEIEARLARGEQP
ncbi:phosphonoacetaldehyde hydrolase [Zavarzinia sp. CC-PAN008]|uniref:phosphonoacetaldehyde hydrolase n=1 Tax=Zavarzinia sp. CC-PAN008 TaxID=3243332 RepID=UPI003F747579